MMPGPRCRQTARLPSIWWLSRRGCAHMTEERQPAPNPRPEAVMPVRLLRTPLIITAFATAAALTTVAPATASSAPRHAGGAAQANAAVATRPTLVYRHLRLPDGGWAQVYSDGLAEVHRPGATAAKSAIEHLPLLNPNGGTGPGGSGTRELPSKGQIIADLAQGSAQPYAAGQVVVIYRPGISAAAIGKAQAGLGVV